MFCLQCGAQNNPPARYCHACGTPLPGIDVSPNPSQNPYGTADHPNSGPNQPNNNASFSDSPYPPPGQPFYDRRSSAALVLGIVGIIFAILLPIICYICSGIGLYIANRDIREGQTYRTGYRTLNIVALCIAAVNSILGMLLYI